MLALLLLICFTEILGENVPIVEIPNLGQIEGHYDKSLNGKQFYSFEGIPYARPPVGKRRFKEPLPVKPWEGVWQAKTIHKCLQDCHFEREAEDSIVGNEDCLYVNIYTPTLDPNANLDVIVYIHGGAFMFLWGGYYGPRFAIDGNVVFINLNYRLGPLGFLSTESDVVPGNNGIKDQILALKFIKDHVKYFGGNPNSITILGMSAGGASVHVHYLSPKSKGLFNRGISQSGTTLDPWVLMENPLEKTKKLAANLGCPTDNIEKLIQCLRKRPGRQIVQQVKAFQPWLYNPFSPFGIVVDSWASDPILPDHPYNLLKAGKVQDLPWIASETNAEGLYPASDFLLKEEYVDYIETNWNQLVPHILDYNYTVDPKLRDDVSQKIRQEYLKNEKLTRPNLPTFVDIISDRLFVNDIHLTVQLQSSVVKSPIYFYYYTYRGAQSWYQSVVGRHEDFGAAHAEDSGYFLSTPIDTASTKEDRQMIKFFVNLFASYAKTGKPKLAIEWKPTSKNSEDVVEGLIINSPTKLSFEKIPVPHEEFWKSLPIIENEKLMKKIKDEL